MDTIKHNFAKKIIDDTSYHKAIQDLMRADFEYQNNLLALLRSKSITPDGFFAALSDRNIEYRQKLSDLQSMKTVVSNHEKRPFLDNKKIALIVALDSADSDDIKKN